MLERVGFRDAAHNYDPTTTHRNGTDPKVTHSSRGNKKYCGIYGEENELEPVNEFGLMLAVRLMGSHVQREYCRRNEHNPQTN